MEKIYCGLKLLADFIGQCAPATPPTLMTIIISIIHEWQTLIAGILALAAAWVTIHHTKQQIKTQKEQLNNELKRQNDERLRNERGARIRVPHALSSVSSYLERCFHHWVSKNSQPFPETPIEALDTLMTLAADIDPATFESIRQLVNDAQILDARLAEHSKSPIASNQRDIEICRILIVRFSTNRLYAYGRGDVPERHYIKPSKEDLLDAVPYCRYDNSDKEQETCHEIDAALRRWFDPLSCKT